MFVASELATAGSVIRNALRIVPGNRRGGDVSRGGSSEYPLTLGGEFEYFPQEKLAMFRGPKKNADDTKTSFAPSRRGVSHLALCSALP